MESNIKGCKIFSISMNKKIQTITEYLKSSEKSDFLIGAELEYFIVDSQTEKSISYYGDNGIESLLLSLSDRGFSADYEAGRIIGVHNDVLAITLEPGAQWEISLKPAENVTDLKNNYLGFINILEPILQHRGQKLHSSGYLPVSRIDEIPFIPKKRYQFMSAYLAKRGKLALNMMKGTASIQVAIDFCNEEDFIRKMRLACRLVPVFSSVYDNSNVFEGEEYQDFALRTVIWNNCDNQRCGIIPQVFQKNFGYQAYAEYILGLIPIFVKTNGKLVPNQKPFADSFDLSANIESQLNHIFSMCFPDVRARNYLELRMTDSLPYPLNFAFIELVNFIFNDEHTFGKIDIILQDIGRKDIIQAKNDIIKKSVQARYGSTTIKEIFREIMNNVPQGEFQYLNQQLITNHLLPRNLHQQGGKLATNI